MTYIELSLAFVAILVAAIFFTNAVEVLGDRLDLGHGTVGSLFAALGTALPETMIPVVAILGAFLTGRDPDSASEIGVGAILGAPFLLATLGMFVVGASVFGFRSRRDNGAEVRIEEESTGRDVRFFFIAFAVAVGAGIVGLPFYLKVALAVLVLGVYGFYVRQTLRSGGESPEEESEELRLWPSGSRAPLLIVLAQLLGALAMMVAGAHFFVEAIKESSSAFGIPAGLITLILAPLATELPETFNSVIWLREGKDLLALGNITGAMVFQSTVPVSVIGLLFTQWHLRPLDILAAALALVSGAFVYALLKSRQPIRAPYLMSAGTLYAAFVIAAVIVVASRR